MEDQYINRLVHFRAGRQWQPMESDNLCLGNCMERIKRAAELKFGIHAANPQAANTAGNGSAGRGSGAAKINKE